MRSEDGAAKEKIATWERHWQTIMLAVVTAALMFTGKFLWEANGKLAELVNENMHVSSQLHEIRGAMNAMQNSYITRNEFAPYVERLRTLESNGTRGR